MSTFFYGPETTRQLVRERQEDLRRSVAAGRLALPRRRRASSSKGRSIRPALRRLMLRRAPARPAGLGGAAGGVDFSSGCTAC